MNLWRITVRKNEMSSIIIIHLAAMYVPNLLTHAVLSVVSLDPHYYL